MEITGAKDQLERALRSSLTALGEDHPYVATVRSNLAVLLRRVDGEGLRAKELADQALTFDLKHFGEDHPNVARDRSNLAWILRDLGDEATARAQVREALRIVEREAKGSWIRLAAERAGREILGAED